MLEVTLFQKVSLLLSCPAFVWNTEYTDITDTTEALHFFGGIGGIGKFGVRMEH